MILDIFINIFFYWFFMVKCTVCGKKIEETFLKKIKGTYIKKKSVCSDCQSKYRKKEDLLKKI